MEKLQMIDYIIGKLYELKVQTEFEDRQRGKKRYVSKTSALVDVINLLEMLYEEESKKADM